VEQQKAGNAALAAPKNIKNKHAESKKIAVKVSLTGTGLRSSTWRSRTLETPTLTALKNIKNKHAEKFVVRSKSKKIAVKVFMVRDRTEEIVVRKQNSGIADTHHPSEHLQEHLNQGVHRADQRAPADRHQPHHQRPQEHYPENLVTPSKVPTSTSHSLAIHHQDQVKTPKLELDENNMEEEPEEYYKVEEELVSVKSQKCGLDRIRSSDGHTFRVEHDVTKKCVNILFDEEVVVPINHEIDKRVTKAVKRARQRSLMAEELNEFNMQQCMQHTTFQSTETSIIKVERDGASKQDTIMAEGEEPVTRRLGREPQQSHQHRKQLQRQGVPQIITTVMKMRILLPRLLWPRQFLQLQRRWRTDHLV
jgi:hypothetical protein